MCEANQKQQDSEPETPGRTIAIPVKVTIDYGGDREAILYEGIVNFTPRQAVPADESR